jgi:hypothetical protein
MELVGACGDVAAWRQEVAEKGQGPGPRQIVGQRLSAAEAEYRNGSHD